MKKVILLAILAGLAWWYFDHSHRLTEADVRASYDADVDAMRRFDAESLCKRLGEDFAGEESSTQDGEAVQHFDKAGQCERIKRSIETMQRFAVATGGRLAMNIEVEIKDIQLAANHKSAIVQSVSVARIGDMTLAREYSTDHLIRRNGRILSTATETRVWTYTPQ